MVPSANNPLQVTAVEPNVHERQTHKDYERIIVQDIEKNIHLFIMILSIVRLIISVSQCGKRN